MHANSSATASAQVRIDRSHLRSLCASARNPSTFIHDLVSTFAEAAPQRLTAMRASLDAGNATEVWAGAYQLVRSTAMVGATMMAQQAWDLATAADAGDETRMAWVLDQLDAELPRTLRDLEAESAILAIAS